LESTPDLYLDELCQDLELHNWKSVSISTIWRMLQKAGYTIKKLTCIAMERNAQTCAEFSARIGEYKPEQLVFVDKSAVD
ncbi:hypothetical protein DFH94DRAFT_619425, partial [Russula ochroleuca]